jgi:aminopeptidase
MGEEIEDIRLRFHDGKTVEAHAAKGERQLQELLSTDAGAPYIGEIGIGTNHETARPTPS